MVFLYGFVFFKKGKLIAVVLCTDVTMGAAAAEAPHLHVDRPLLREGCLLLGGEGTGAMGAAGGPGSGAVGAWPSLPGVAFLAAWEESLCSKGRHLWV